MNTTLPIELDLEFGWGRILVCPTADSEQFLLYLQDHTGEYYFEDYYMSEKEALRVARHLKRCCSFAKQRGYTLYKGMFDHPQGHYLVPMINALDPNAGMAGFRKTLRKMEDDDKKGHHEVWPWK